MADQIELYGEGLKLGPKELISFSRLDPQLPHSGLKAQEPTGSVEQAVKLSHRQAQQRELLNEERVARFGSLSVGDWNQDLQLIEVRSGKGKFWQMMGYNAGNKKYLYPEEGLYLMEMNTLELFYQGIPLSLQQAFELLIPIEFSLEEYQTYAHLMRLGYIVTRHKQTDITEYEQRIKLFRNRTNRWQRARKKVQVWFDKLGDGVNDSPNSSDSGDATDGSYSSSSSGSRISLNSAGDFDAKFRSSHQESREEKKELLDKDREPIDAEEMEEEGSSEYSDGPISELSPQEHRGDSGFDHSLVNLLDYHKRHCSSSNEERPVKVVKRKNASSWYMTSLNSAGSSSRDSESWGPPAPKKPREATTGVSVAVSDSSKVRALACGADAGIPMEKYREASEDAGNRANPRSGTADQEAPETSMDVEEFLQAVVKRMHKEKKRKLKRGKKKTELPRPYSLWNFTGIHIPDLSMGPLGPGLLSAQALTGALRASGHGTGKDLLPRANMPKPRLGSQKNSDNVEQRDSVLDSCSKRYVAVDGRGESADETSRPPTNWRDYKSLLKKPGKDLKDLLVSPVSHLWAGSVQPLVRPADAVSPEYLMRQLQVIQSVDNEDLSRSCDSSKYLKITFDVHLPDSTYKKSCPGKPAFHIVIFSIQDPVPDLRTQMSILRQSSGVPLIFALVDNADTTFCCFSDAKKMTDIS